jgi:hypothetical protein
MTRLERRAVGFGRMGTGDNPKARAHDILALVLTIAAVHTDSDRFRKIAAGGRNAEQASPMPRVSPTPQVS